MDKYTASNGVIIHEQDGHVSLWSRERGVLVVGSGNFGTALKEYVNHVREEAVYQRADEVQAKRDFELGRWRWPENPEYVVYPKPKSNTEPLPGVRVVHEVSGRAKDVERVVIGACEATVSVFGEAARAYFDAHPEPKPWHDAKPGETWRLTVNDRQPEDLDLTFNVIGVEGTIQARFARPQVSGEQMEYRIDSPAIVAGRRIWPADAS